MTPLTLKKGDSMHQKQPPAKVAWAVAAVAAGRPGPSGWGAEAAYGPAQTPKTASREKRPEMPGLSGLAPTERLRDFGMGPSYETTILRVCRRKPADVSGGIGEVG